METELLQGNIRGNGRGNEQGKSRRKRTGRRKISSTRRKNIYIN
jgi:hypothetical protein